MRFVMRSAGSASHLSSLSRYCQYTMTAMLKLRTLVIYPDPNTLHRASDRVVLSPPTFLLSPSRSCFMTHMKLINTRMGLAPSVLTSDYRLTDIEYADDTVLLSRTRLSPHRFLHTLQAHSLKRGMSLNQEKCQLLAINSDLPIYLIDFPSHSCQCGFCLTKPNPFLPKDLRIEPTPHADYLGSVLMYNSSATADTKKRYGQAAHAAKCLHDFL